MSRIKKSTVSIVRRGRAVVAELKGRNHKFYEDRYRLLSAEIEMVYYGDRGEIFAVFDGVGGANMGMAAAQAMADCLIEFFEHEDRHEASVDGLRQLLEQTNEAIRDWGTEVGSDVPLGACAGTIAWLRDRDVTLFHVGDTEAWTVTDTGADVVVSGGPSVGLHSYWGLGTDLSIIIKSFSLQADERLLLFSDGLPRAVPQSEIRRIMAEEDDSEKAACRLVTYAEDRRAPDDVTVLIVDP